MNLYNEVKIPAADGIGSFSAFVSYHEEEKPAPAVIVIQEIFGVNENMRRICENLSQAGYVAICPDLFWRQEPGVQLSDKTEAGWARAFQLYQGFNVGKGVEDLKATLSFIRRNERCTGKVGTLGYCLGGRLAYLMATRSNADCNVSYYGVEIETLLNEAQNIKNPLLMHIAAQDKFVPPEAQTKILTALKDVRPVKLHVYPGVDHAFARVGGEHYNKEAAQQADERSMDFLAVSLSGN